ncbi:copper chaperone PCu(A)C [Roseomonas hellenica]|uniref:Copper chaperone PCu(A)C n=1 Tax=Plastoroseomonas hellenica TaxID=2687306 RepID=A0ABS5F4Q1_9PROT|nr:copper chaperone PCu(A)C [Plastoroseomonas hellenica]MBR0667481.1 copper chaperone PCu(A)C [Plastoroseomonas hellenica]
MTATRRSLLIGAALLAALPAAAQDRRAGDLVIERPWSRAAGANATGVGFLTIRNTGAAPDRLLSASSPIARRVELHTMSMDGAVMRMRPVEDIAVPAGGTVQLAPGGLHIMLIGLTQPLAQGGRAPLTLRFERAGEVQVELSVEAAGARAPQHAH